MYKNPAIQNRRGSWKIGDAFTITGNTLLYVTEDTIVPDNAVWIARTIDDSSPEARKRSLWGMVDWSRFDAEVLPNGKLWIANRSHHVMEKSEFGAMLIPTEAILRALLAQEGIEV